jgi:hypothetical protein
VMSRRRRLLQRTRQSSRPSRQLPDAGPRAGVPAPPRIFFGAPTDADTEGGEVDEPKDEEGALHVDPVVHNGRNRHAAHRRHADLCKREARGGGMREGPGPGEGCAKVGGAGSRRARDARLELGRFGGRPGACACSHIQG